jgi:hypothetical protein
MGLTSNYVARIMDPNYEEMRRYDTVKEWAPEMIEMRYEFLRQLDHTIQDPSLGVHGQAAHLGDDGKLYSGRPIVPPRTHGKSSSSSSQKSPVATFKTTPAPSISTSFAQPPSKLDGHKILLKGSIIGRLKKIDIAGENLNFRNITSTPSGDFSDLVGGLYFTKNPQVAWKYADWARKFVDGQVVPVGIMHIAIPNELFDSMLEVHGNDWKEFVFANRTGNAVINASYRLGYLRGVEWLVGPICKASMENVQDYSSSDEVQSLKLAGNETAQQFWTGSGIMIDTLSQ